MSEKIKWKLLFAFKLIFLSLNILSIHFIISVPHHTRIALMPGRLLDKKRFLGRLLVLCFCLRQKRFLTLHSATQEDFCGQVRHKASWKPRNAC